MLTIIHGYRPSLTRMRKLETIGKTQLSPKPAKDCGSESDYYLFLELPICCVYISVKMQRSRWITKDQHFI
jgi:hypothetical protein